MSKKKEIRTITGDWVKSLVGMGINEIVYVPYPDYDNVMSSAKYRARRKHKVEIERVEDIDHENDRFKIKRIA